MQILKISKEVFPDAKLRIISNGTFRMTGKYGSVADYVSNIGFSIDGATKETFEEIRAGGNFERVIRNITELAEDAKRKESPLFIGFVFTASTRNIHELPDLVRLAAKVGARRVYCQPMRVKMKTLIDKFGHTTLDKMPPAELEELLKSARAVARELGMQLIIAPAVRPDHADDEPDDDDTQRPGAEKWVPYCDYIWDRPPFVQVDSWVMPCCYMPINKNTQDQLQKYELADPRDVSLGDIYNSEGYWRLREDMAHGRTREMCGACVMAKGGYERWRDGKMIAALKSSDHADGSS